MIEVEILKKGNQTLYYIKGTTALHREDGPAAIDHEHREWFLNGVRHRVDGPAYEGFDGYKEWYINGKLHREDGPAVFLRDVIILWYLNGIHLSKEEWFEALTEDKKEKALYSEYFIGD
jgi:hypothetical protein